MRIVEGDFRAVFKGNIRTRSKFGIHECIAVFIALAVVILVGFNDSGLLYVATSVGDNRCVKAGLIVGGVVKSDIREGFSGDFVISFNEGEARSGVTRNCEVSERAFIKVAGTLRVVNLGVVARAERESTAFIVAYCVNLFDCARVNDSGAVRQSSKAVGVFVVDNSVAAIRYSGDIDNSAVNREESFFVSVYIIEESRRRRVHRDGAFSRSEACYRNGAVSRIERNFAFSITEFEFSFTDCDFVFCS